MIVRRIVAALLILGSLFVTGCASTGVSSGEVSAEIGAEAHD